MKCEWLITGSIKMSGTFIHQMHLKNFPFDCQSLGIDIWARHTFDVMNFVPYFYYFQKRTDKGYCSFFSLSHFDLVFFVCVLF